MLLYQSQANITAPHKANIPSSLVIQYENVKEREKKKALLLLKGKREKAAVDVNLDLLKLASLTCLTDWLTI